MGGDTDNDSNSFRSERLLCVVQNGMITLLLFSFFFGLPLAGAGAIFLIRKDDPGAIINIMARVGVNQDLTLTRSVPWLSLHMIPTMMIRK